MSARLLIILEENAFSKYSSRNGPLIPYSVIGQSRDQYLYNLLQQTIISAESTIFLRFQYSYDCDHIVFTEKRRHSFWANSRHPELIIERPNEHHFEWITRAVVYERLQDEGTGTIILNYFSRSLDEIWTRSLASQHHIWKLLKKIFQVIRKDKYLSMRRHTWGFTPGKRSNFSS